MREEPRVVAPKCRPERQRGTFCDLIVAGLATTTFTEDPSSLSLLGMTLSLDQH